MNIISKGLFTLKNKKSDEKPIPQKDSELVNMYDWGWDRAKALRGQEPGLLVCVRNIYENHKEELRRNEEEQEKAKIPYKNKVHELTSEKNSLIANIEKIQNKKIPFLKEKVAKCNNEIKNIRENPEQYLGDKVGKAGFVIGAIILFFLTIYLFVFYSSASFSAFFKEFSLNEIGVASSIFDPQALSKGLQDGITELVLILTIPFVFIGLGYLIHKFQEVKGWTKIPKIAMLILVTFIFDSILAYEITEKIYNIKASNSFEALPEYNLSFAFHSINFWLIIFAGFVVYIIWGFVFDYFMESYAKLDRIAVLTKNQNEEKAQIQKEIETYENETLTMSNNLAQKESEINKFNTFINHSEIIKPKELELSLYQFLNGWLEWLNSDRKDSTVQDQAKQIVEKFVSENIKSLHIINNN
ncbi:MAG: hypothetical protein PHS54_07575 [Clostridia bacterium]|nr:hypothetical protein [Clostridia bacterium]